MLYLTGLQFLLFLLVMFPNWVFAQIPIPGDSNRDGLVDTKDALILEQNWHKGSQDNITIDIATPLPMRFVRIPAGSFMMGSPDTERNRETREGPVHQVTFDYDFYLGETEVTQKQYQFVTGKNPSEDFGIGDNFPVYYVTWNDCQAFIAALNALGNGTFRLPSEAEWEYACRAGTTSRYYFGSSTSCKDDCTDCLARDPIIIEKAYPFGNDEYYRTFLTAPNAVITLLARSDFMWFCANTDNTSQPVRQLRPNAFGLYDMLGNVGEWCQDFSHSNYIGAPTDGSAWLSNPDSNGLRVIRGGSHRSTAGLCRSASRIGNNPAVAFGNVGFRVVRMP